MQSLGGGGHVSQEFRCGLQVPAYDAAQNYAAQPNSLPFPAFFSFDSEIVQAIFKSYFDR